MTYRRSIASRLRLVALLALVASLGTPWFRIWGSCDMIAGDRYCGYTYVDGLHVLWGDFVLVCTLALLVVVILQLRGRSSLHIMRLDFLLTWVTLVWIVAAGMWHASITIRGNGIGHTWWGAGLGFVLALAQVVILGYQMGHRDLHDGESRSDFETSSG
jgi:hypothetical protein